MEGTIAKITDRGYGFIEVEDEEDDVFFHASSLVEDNFDELEEGTTVKFEVEEGDKGLNAVNVERV